jgi:hypothetical protein
MGVRHLRPGDGRSGGRSPGGSPGPTSGSPVRRSPEQMAAPRTSANAASPAGSSPPPTPRERRGDAVTGRHRRSQALQDSTLSTRREGTRSAQRWTSLAVRMCGSARSSASTGAGTSSSRFTNRHGAPARAPAAELRPPRPHGPRPRPAGSLDARPQDPGPPRSPRPRAGRARPRPRPHQAGRFGREGGEATPSQTRLLTETEKQRQSRASLRSEACSRCPERVLTISRTACSRSAGPAVHDRRNTHPGAPRLFR